ncbi:hypothetical protein [Natrinema caseinilyticum]|uniref:hypothetical protein n=1 Tax=Natrinema caseinilyticum TaxID=2961570 RepID=UPI0020C377C5|nr:hypothetical protein [Natrinema caseinilyticum]
MSNGHHYDHLRVRTGFRRDDQKSIVVRQRRTVRRDGYLGDIDRSCFHRESPPWTSSTNEADGMAVSRHDSLESHSIPAADFSSETVAR